MTGKRCENCAFYKSYGNGGECKRYPPTLQGSGVEHRFPMVAPYDWCGEFKRQPQPGKRKSIPHIPGFGW